MMNTTQPLNFSSLIVPQTYIKTHYDKSFSMKIHAHKTLEVIYCVSGRISIEESNGKETTLIPHQFVIIMHECFHRVITHSDDVEILVLELSSPNTEERFDEFVINTSLFSSFPSLPNILNSEEDVLRFSDSSNVYDILLRLVNLLSEKRYSSKFFEADYEIAIKQLFLSFCRVFRSQHLNVSHDRYFNRALEFIGLHYAEAITSEDVAAYMGVTPSYAQKLCRTATNMTIMKIVHYYRLKQSEYLIASTRLPFADIAKQTGFGSLSNLYKHFLASHNCSPSQYRNQLSEKSFYIFNPANLAKNLSIQATNNLRKEDLNSLKKQ